MYIYIYVYVYVYVYIYITGKLLLLRGQAAGHQKNNGILVKAAKVRTDSKRNEKIRVQDMWQNNLKTALSEKILREHGTNSKQNTNENTR